jgi:hypothetical protein
VSVVLRVTRLPDVEDLVTRYCVAAAHFGIVVFEPKQTSDKRFEEAPDGAGFHRRNCEPGTDNCRSPHSPNPVFDVGALEVPIDPFPTPEFHEAPYAVPTQIECSARQKQPNLALSTIGLVGCEDVTVEKPVSFGFIDG